MQRQSVFVQRLLKYYAMPDGRSAKESVSVGSWLDVKVEIMRLGKGGFQDLDLTGDLDLPRLTVSGGRAGRYIAVGTFDDRSYHHLIARSPFRGERQVVWIGGQATETDSHLAVRLDEVLQAANVFVNSGDLEPAASWYTI